VVNEFVVHDQVNARHQMRRHVLLASKVWYDFHPELQCATNSVILQYDSFSLSMEVGMKAPSRFNILADCPAEHVDRSICVWNVGYLVVADAESDENQLEEV
jgi:hypothetical protein